MFAVQLLRVLETIPKMTDNTWLKANMKETQHWATFDDNEDDKILKSSETEWDKDLHTANNFNGNGFENNDNFLASPIGESFKERDLYTDKKVVENPVKDIWVDNGMPLKETVLTDGENCKIGSEESKSLTKSECVGVVGYDNDVNDDAIEVLSEKLVADDDMLLSGKSSEVKSLKALFDSRSSDSSDVEHLSDQIKSTSKTPAVGPPDDDSNKGSSDLSYDSKVESGKIIFNFESSKLEADSKNDNTREQSVKVHDLPTHDSAISNNNLNDENKAVQDGLGESSFSKTDTVVSGRINYSGPIPFSGSLSIRSDSSTTSTRSFAFPILPNEWNSSPVRMAKANRRKKGRKISLFCCRF